MVVLLSEGSCLFASEADAFKGARKAHVTDLCSKKEGANNFPGSLPELVEKVQTNEAFWSQPATLHHALARTCRRVCATTPAFRYP
jgi:hypothetical protein